MLRSILREINHLTHTNDVVVREILELNIDYRQELIYEDKGEILANPLIALGEKNLIEMERDIAIIQVLLIFIPIMFTMIHFFIAFDFSVSILNMLLVYYILSMLVQHPYRLKASHLLYLLQRDQEVIVHSPHTLTDLHHEVFENPSVLELSILPQMKSDRTSKFFAMLIIVLLKLDQSVSEHLLENFLKNTMDIVRVQDIQDKKWQAYTVNYKFVIYAIVFFVSG